MHIDDVNIAIALVDRASRLIFTTSISGDHIAVRGRKAKAKPEGLARTLNRKVRVPKRPITYHHGSLRTALLRAAERILERDGIQGLTLRAAAREAGVSHAAPKNHFGDMSGLLSDLAAVGFERIAATMLAGVRDTDPPGLRLEAVGRGYVTFAREHPGLFLLMYRSERLDIERPALRDAVIASGRVLYGAVGAVREEDLTGPLTLAQAAHIVSAWSLVHGFAVLLLDGRLKLLMSRLSPETGADALLKVMLDASTVKDPRTLKPTEVEL
jgi:AcrR family transcriptional regulator